MNRNMLILLLASALVIFASVLYYNTHPPHSPYPGVTPPAQGGANVR
jgi:hypothetical protein